MVPTPLGPLTSAPSLCLAPLLDKIVKYIFYNLFGDIDFDNIFYKSSQI
jgi:hypothetical protein